MPYDPAFNKFIKDIPCKECGQEVSKDVVSQLLQFAGRDPRRKFGDPPTNFNVSVSEGARPTAPDSAVLGAVVIEATPVQTEPPTECECFLCGETVTKQPGVRSLSCQCPSCGAPSMFASDKNELIDFLRSFNDTVDLVKSDDAPFSFPVMSTDPATVYENRDVSDPTFHLNAIRNLADALKHQLRGCMKNPTFGGVRRAYQGLELFELIMRKTPFKTGTAVVNSAKFKKAKSALKKIFQKAGGLQGKMPTESQIDSILSDVEDAVSDKLEGFSGGHDV